MHPFGREPAKTKAIFLVGWELLSVAGVDLSVHGYWRSRPPLSKFSKDQNKGTSASRRAVSRHCDVAACVCDAVM